MTSPRRATTAEELARTCPGPSVLDHVTSRWGVLILSVLHERELRFAELRDRMPGISEKILAETLRLLVGDRLVERIPRPSSAPHVSYVLTDRGVEVNQPLQELLARIARHTAAEKPVCSPDGRPRVAQP
jgi:DNA-binding HxlR family transcriptional regulator